MEVVAGLSLRNLKPRIWEVASPYYLPALTAVMVSYGEFHQMPVRRREAMDQGLHAALGIPSHIRIYLDNGAFYFLGKGGETPRADYEAFVVRARPDWYAIPQDYIPTPRMSDAEQLACLERTMTVNRDYGHDGYVPVIHISRHLDIYLQQFQADERLRAKSTIALGGIVPNLLRAPRAMAYSTVLEHVRRVRSELHGRQLHVFGIGGTATLHLAALLEIDSVDSAGWRNRAARGIVQLPGRGDRMVADMGTWRGREPSAEEWALLEACCCPGCRTAGIAGLRASGVSGFSNRATHNLWILLDEARQIEAHLRAGDYAHWYRSHLDNTVYLPLIEQTLHQTQQDKPL